MIGIRIFVLVCVVVIGGLPYTVGAADVDYNKEFSDNYFKLDTSDADVNLKVIRKSPATKVDPISKQDGSSRKKETTDDKISLSTLGKILQLSLVVMLGLLIYTLSRRSKKKKGF